jgi:hypothetical protein
MEDGPGLEAEAHELTKEEECQIKLDSESDQGDPNETAQKDEDDHPATRFFRRHRWWMLAVMLITCCSAAYYDVRF